MIILPILQKPSATQMKGFVPVEIPTKRYIKAYIHSKLGEKPLMTTNGNTIGHKLYDLLQHSTNERATVFDSKHYTEKIRIYIPISIYKKRGAYLNQTNIKNFNIYVENEIKDRFHWMMDDLISALPNFSANLPEVRRRLGIDIESWSDDSMTKDYYRYRVATGKSLLYTKNSQKSFSQSVRQAC